MNIEYIILGIAWLICIVSLITFVPKNKIRQAIVIAYFKHILTWVFGLLVVELNMIEYPVRLFQYANRTSFTFEFMVYPTICVFFNLYFPEKKSRARQLLQYIIYSSVITIIEVVLLKYTDLINYINWTWYWTWITLLITFYITRRLYLWFYNEQ